MTNPFLSPATVWMYTLKALRPEIKTEGPTPDEASIVGQHWAYLQELRAADRLIFAGRTLDLGEEGFATVIIRAPSESVARGVMEADPGVRGRVFTARLHPYQTLLIGSMEEPPS